MFMNYGASFQGFPPRRAAGEVSRFARAAIVHQPGAYLGQVARDSWRVISPGAPSTVGRGNLGAGLGQQELINAYFDPGWMRNSLYTVAPNRYYLGLAVTDHGVGFFRAWERVFRFTGPLMALTALLALLAPCVCPRPLRRPAVLLLAVGLVLLLVPILTTMYDARYVVPALGPLAAAAALGATGLLKRVGGGSSSLPRSPVRECGVMST
jgi:hypothetical protein